MKAYKKVLLGMGAFGVIFVVPTLIFLHDKPPVPGVSLSFLEGRTIVESSLISTAAQSSGNMFDAIAVYSWPENYQAFRARAATELHAKGFVREVANGKTYSWENWERKDGCSVMLQPAAKLGVSTLDDSRETPAFRDDPSWVSVIVFGDAPDTPLNHLRYGLQ